MTHAILKLDPHNMSVLVRDPLVVRAEMVVRDANHLGAVVEGVMLDLGPIDDDLIAAVSGQSHLELHATHFDGGTIRRRIPIVHH